MPAITFTDFSVGKDLRKGASVADANRLRDLVNAYVTSGKAIRKRPGGPKVATLEAGTVGLSPGNGVLNTFYESGTITHANPLFKANKIDHGSVSTPVVDVHFADVFNGFLYVVAEYANGDVKHHYFDQSPTLVTDANVPSSKSAIKMEQKIWSPDGDIVRFSKTGNPRDWTLADDAGFLPTGLHQVGNENALGLGQYGQHGLVVFHVDGSQLWNVDPDPALHNLLQVLPGTQTRYPKSIVPLYSDLYFLSDSGFRSMSEEVLTNNKAEVDIGSPIDPDVQAEIEGMLSKIPFSSLSTKFGQYWGHVGNKVYTFTLSRTVKIAAWAVYEYPYVIDTMAELDGNLYLRSGDDVYLVTRNVFNDDGATYESRIEMAYVNAKKPGLLKKWWGFDMICTGTANISFKFNPNQPTFETTPIAITGDSQGNDMHPIEITSVAIAPVITHNADEDFQLDALTLYYSVLGAR